MQTFKFNIFVPFEVGDIIKKKDNDSIYELIDIQHIFSAKFGGIYKTNFIIKNNHNETKHIVPYEDNVWEIVSNDEI